MKESINLNPLELSRKNNCSTFLFFVLSKITFGFFTAYRLEKMTNIINEFSGEGFNKITKNIYLLFQILNLIFFMFFVAFAFVVIYFISYLHYYNTHFHMPYYSNSLLDENLPSLFFTYVFIILIPSFVMKTILIIWSFNAKKSLDFYCLKEIKFPYELNSLYIILFDVLYINYFLNNIGMKYERFNLIHKID